MTTTLVPRVEFADRSMGKAFQRLSDNGDRTDEEERVYQALCQLCDLVQTYGHRGRLLVRGQLPAFIRNLGESQVRLLAKDGWRVFYTMTPRQIRILDASSANEGKA